MEWKFGVGGWVWNEGLGKKGRVWNGGERQGGFGMKRGQAWSVEVWGRKERSGLEWRFGEGKRDQVWNGLGYEVGSGMKVWGKQERWGLEWRYEFEPGAEGERGG